MLFRQPFYKQTLSLVVDAAKESTWEFLMQQYNVVAYFHFYQRQQDITKYKNANLIGVVQKRTPFVDHCFSVFPLFPFCLLSQLTTLPVCGWFGSFTTCTYPSPHHFTMA